MGAALIEYKREVIEIKAAENNKLRPLAQVKLTLCFIRRHNGDAEEVDDNLIVRVYYVL